MHSINCAHIFVFIYFAGYIIPVDKHDAFAHIFNLIMLHWPWDNRVVIIAARRDYGTENFSYPPVSANTFFGT